MKRKLSNAFLTCYTFLFFGCVGIMYPEYVYSFIELDDRPNYGAEYRFANKDLYTNEIDLVFSRPGNQIESYIHMSIFVKQKYEKLFIHEMSFIYENNIHIIMKDETFLLPEQSSINTGDPTNYYEKDGFFWTIYLRPIDGEKDLRYINLKKIFNDKVIGDVFNASLNIKYSFDDESLKKDTINYSVIVGKGSYISPFMGL